MEESLRSRLVLILAIFTILFFLVAIGSCSNAHRYKLVRDKEMTSRLEVEEKMNKMLQEKASLEEKLKKQEKEFEEVRAAFEAVKKTLVQEELINQSLREELAKVVKLKEAIEEDFKDALVKSKQEKPKK